MTFLKPFVVLLVASITVAFLYVANSEIVPFHITLSDVAFYDYAFWVIAGLAAVLIEVARWNRSAISAFWSRLVERTSNPVPYPV